MLLPLCEGPTISCDHSGLERIGPDQQPGLSRSEPMYLDLAECSILNRSVTSVGDIIPPEWDDPSPLIASE